MSAIAIHEVWKAFGRQPVLRGFSLALPKGAATALLGPSGSGKTTILRLLAGLDVPDRGRITIGERVVSGDGELVPPWERGIGMVFQDLALWPHMRVRRQLAFVLPHLNRAARRARIDALLELADLGDKAKRLPSQLSGGEQQRLAIARALAPQPEILLLDEPFAHLDQDLRDVFAGHLAALKATGVTILIATHHEGDIAHFADRVVHIQPVAHA